MKTVFIRNPLHDTVEAHLRAAIARGDYRDTLPGERVIAETLGVSRPVLRRALEALIADGVISRRHGRATRIINPDIPAEGTPVDSGRVAMLSSQPFHELSSAAMEAFYLLEQHLAAKSLTLVFRFCEPFRHRDNGRSLPAFVKGLPASVYLLHQTPDSAQHWFARQKHPCVVMGSPAADTGLCGVDSDYAPASRHAVGELKRLGHDPARIVLTLPEIILPGQLTMIEGFLDAGGRKDAILRHPTDRADLPVWIATRLLPRLSEPDGPTALLSGWNRFTIALVSGLSMRHGVRIPDSLSVVGLADDPVFPMLIPAITCYGRSAEKYVEKLTRLVVDITKHRQPGGGTTLRITPEFIEGGTIAAPRVRPL